MKKRAITQLVFISVLVAILAFFAFVPFTVPGTYFDWQGFWGGIKYGVDVKGGVYSTFEIKNDDDEISNKTIKNEVNKLYGQFVKLGYLEPNIEISGNAFTVKIPKYDGSRDVLTAIANKSEIIVSSSSSFDGVNDTNSLSFRNIKKVSVSQASGGYGVTVEYSDKAMLKTISSLGTIYFYEGGESFNYIPSLSVDNAYEDGKLTFGSSNMERELADYFAMKFFAGTINLTITQTDWDDANPTLGEYAPLILGMVFGALFIACLITLICLYKRFGLVASLSLIILACFTGLFLNALPFVNLSLIGIFGIVFGAGLIIASMIYIFESIKKELKTGKKLPTATRFGLQKVWKKLLIVLSVVFVLAFGLVWIPVGGMMSFMHSVLITIPIGMLCLLLLWWFIMLCLKINSTKVNKYFTKFKVKELKTQE